MYTVLLILYIFIVILMSLIILIQEPREGGLGGVFGGGGMENILGAKEAPTLFTKITAVLGGIFIILSLVLSYLNQPVGARSAYQKALMKAMQQQRRAAPVQTQQPPSQNPVQPSNNKPSTK